MGWDSVFSIINLWALIAWLLLVLGPRRPLALSAILYLGVGVLALVYTVLIAGLLSGGIDSGAAGGASAPDFTTLPGVMALFETPGGATLGWTHYLAFDLFVGLWIARDADGKGFGRLFQAPFLVLTFLVGPVGLLAYLILRESRARRAAR